METKGTSWQLLIKQFYARRFLRIFPLYYFVIGVGVLMNLEPAREAFVWLATYTLNFYMAHLGWFVDHYAHFWTLAVEEQFYIVWPWLILFTPRKWLVPSCVLFVLVGPAYRFYEILFGMNGLGFYITTPACLDALCMGALLSIAYAHVPDKEKISSYLNKVVLPASILGLIIINIGFVEWRIGSALFDFFLAMFFCWLVAQAGRSFSGPLGTLLETRSLVYVGKISYGLYVYHPFMPRVTQYIFEKAGWAFTPHGAVDFVVSTVLSLAVSSLSWYLMEKPINDLKRFFEYEDKKQNSEKKPVFSEPSSPARNEVAVGASS